MARLGMPLRSIGGMNCALSEAHVSTPGSPQHKEVGYQDCIVHDACNTISSRTAKPLLPTR
eukprot:654989-Amphidinium_carterae.3